MDPDAVPRPDAPAPALPDPAFEAAVAAILVARGRPAAEAAAQARFAAALRRANERLNLTSITDPEGMAIRHVLDSLTLLPLLGPTEHVLDLGSGGGLPGIPLAIARPDLRLTLIEGREKKAAALTALVEELGLSRQVAVVQGRGEEWLPRHPVDTVVARAIGTVPDVLARLSRVRRAFGRLVLMKGPAVEAELAEAAPRLRGWGFGPPERTELDLPAGAGHRVLLVFRRR